MQTNLKLFLAVFIISWGSILVRWAGDVHPLVISFYRLFFSILILFPIVLSKESFKTIPIKKHFLIVLLAGLMLALHFYTWITSLQMTTVGRSIFLESTHPVFAVILSFLFLKEKASKAFIPALLLGLVGMYFTVFSDISPNSSALAGDGLAIFSAFCMAAYLIVARKTRLEIPLQYYLLLVYGSAALFLFIAILWLQLNFLIFSSQAWVMLILLALGPNLIGHSMLNWASRKMPVYRVNMVLLSESVLATLMAALFLSEFPDSMFYIGALLILSSIGWIFFKEKFTNTSSA